MTEEMLSQGKQIYDENFAQIGPNKLSWYEWGIPSPEVSSILLIHATGFHGRCWNQVVKGLEGKHVIALDMRGHGDSENNGPFTWNVFGEDIAAFVKHLNLTNLTAVGHSLGGYAVMHAMALDTERYKRALLIDPVIMNPEFYSAGVAQHDQFLNEAGQHPVARRRNRFRNSQEMYENFVDRGSFGYWTKDALRDYCQYGLKKMSNDTDLSTEGYELACPPTIEASIYMGSTSVDIIALTSKINLPVTVLRAKQRDTERTELDFSKSPTWPGLAESLPQGRDVYLPELSHFMPMQDPEMIAEAILNLK
jgi:pimeloyl-ACP methyl ester carboxylesterase